MISSLFVIIVSLQYILVNTYSHQKPLHKTLWSERCKKHDVVLNDCNWCWCSDRHRYNCKSRVCQEIDMFGHFKDAIQEINVGMEGHGVWRSTETACSPGVHYRRGALLCVCNEDGNWPNPICRDILRVLHSVELTSITYPTPNYTCSPTKLYVVGCNVCFCPSQGFLNPDLCTNNTCLKDDPVLEVNVTKIARTEDKIDDKNLEIYALCKTDGMYSLGCMSCKCLQSNRLLCGSCFGQTRSISASYQDSLDKSCRERITGEVFNNDCNLCYCDEKYRKICTIRKCIKDIIPLAEVAKQTKHKTQLMSTTTPVDDEDCTPGTMFNKDCNTCKCMKLNNGKKIIQCTVRLCNRTSPLEVIKHNCISNTAYEWKCMLCYCEDVKGEKVQTCYANTACHASHRSKTLFDIKLLHGYCDPLQTYKDDCNKCRCLTDGETSICTTKKCVQKSSDPISVEIVPVKRTKRNICPKGHSFKLKCNICFCLSNSNAMCTTADCLKKTPKIKPIIN